MRPMPLRLAPSTALREKRLARLLAERGLDRGDPRLASLVEDAVLVGSLALSGIAVSWEEARGGSSPVGELAALRRARAAVPVHEPLTVSAIRAWHAALLGPIGFRRPVPAGAEAPAAEGVGRGAPAELVEGRIAHVVEWLETEGSSQLGPEAKAALALARVVEIRPFEDGNGRVSRLAAAHVLERAGAAPPVLVSGDAARLRSSLEAAFRLDTAPLVELLREASLRSLDVKIQALERGLV
jgi:hypothetical protein